MAKKTSKMKVAKPLSVPLEEGVQEIKFSTADAPSVERADLATLWADRMVVQVRGNPNIAVLRFFTILMSLDNKPANIEQTRVMITLEHARKIVSVLARVTDYYPTREEIAADVAAGAHK